MDSGTFAHFWAVVPAGGAGTRLWPLSRAGSPKFLHDLTGTGRSLLRATADRLAPLAGERVLVVTGVAHADAVRAQLPGAEVLAEPSPRDSMAAVGLAAAILELRDPEAVMGSFAADHVITDEAAFTEAVRLAVAAAGQDWLVTIGIQPDHPATGFGYVHLGDPLPDHPGVRRARAFVEKPDEPTARAYLAGGEHRWNAGMFVVRPRVLLDLLARWHPGLAADLRRIATEPALLPELWPGLRRIALDHAVAEPAAAAGRVAVVPAAFDWEDVGDFASLHGLLRGGTPSGVTTLGEESLVRALDSTGLVVPAAGRVVAVVGLEDVVVVDTDDALLVTRLDRAQQVKDVVTGLVEEGRADLT